MKKNLCKLLTAISMSFAAATKVNLHEIENAQITRSFNPRSNIRDVGSNRVNFRGNATAANGTVASQETTNAEDSNEEDETSTAIVNNALSIGIADVVTKPPSDETTSTASSSRKDQISPFLSTTLLTTLSPIATSTLSTFNTQKQSSFGNAFIAFLEHVLLKQEVYDVKVLSVSIFDEELINMDSGEVEERGGRLLLTNGLQFNFARDDDYAYDDDDADDAVTEVEASEDGDDDAMQQEEEMSDNNQNKEQWVYKSLRFGIVLSAEHVNQPSEVNYMSNEQFQKIILHISSKFHDHLLEYVKDADLYFRNVEKVDMGSYIGDGGLVDQEVEAVKNGILKRVEDEIKSMEEGSLNTWSIVAMVLGGVAFVGLMFATVKVYKREKVLQANRWRSQEIANSNANATNIKSLRVLYGKQPPFEDDYSFDPLGTNVVQEVSTTRQRPNAKEHIQRLYKGFTGRGYTDIPLNNSADEEIAFSKWPKVAPEAPSPLFPGAPPISVTKSTVSYTLDDERLTTENLLYNLPRQHVYAPPGKVGVAIDIQDGQPVVHKIRKGSPLEGLLQPQDIVVAIDDVDTNCMSASDVTHLMVKRMNYRRKITFVRRG